MTTQIQRRRGTTAQHGTFTGAVAELTVDTTKDTVVVHDGAQVGGYPLLREDGSNSALALGSAATPSIKFTGDTNTGIYSPGADQVAISTNGTGRLFVDASGRVLTGAATAQETKARNLTFTPQAQLLGTGTAATAALYAIYSNSDTSSATQQIAKSRGASVGTHVALVANDRIGAFSFAGSDGTSFTEAANIEAFVDGTPGTNIMPGRLVFSTRSTTGTTVTTEHMRLDSTGRLGLGTSSPTGKLDVSSSTAYAPGGSFNDGCVLIGSSGSKLAFSYDSTNQANITALEPGVDWRALTLNAGDVVIKTGGSERARIDSFGRLLVGTSTGVSAAFVNSSIQAHSLTGDGSSVILYRFTTSATAAATPRFVMARSGSDSKDFTVVANGNRLGQLNFVGADGTQFISAASIDCEVDGTPGANDMPGRLVFSVTADGASSPTEALRISNNRAITVSDGGNVVLGTTTGTKIGTATTQKLGFYNATPVVQPTAVADATDAASVITQLNALLTRMRNLGLIAT
jgi:hypothetical protein